MCLREKDRKCVYVCVRKVRERERVSECEKGKRVSVFEREREEEVKENTD